MKVPELRIRADYEATLIDIVSPTTMDKWGVVNLGLALKPDSEALFLVRLARASDGIPGGPSDYEYYATDGERFWACRHAYSRTQPPLSDGNTYCTKSAYSIDLTIATFIKDFLKNRVCSSIG